MPLENQIFAKLKRILPSPDGNNEYYIVIVRDNPLPAERLKDLQKEWGDQEVIITITTLIKGKKKHKVLKEEMELKEETQEPTEFPEEDPTVGQYGSEFEGEGM